MKEEMTIRVRLDRKTFARFALFDALVLKRRWVRPALFSAMLLSFAAVAFLFSEREQATLVGVVLTAVGLALPVAYWGGYLTSVRKKARALKLDASWTAYLLRLSDAGVTVEGGDKTGTLDWERLYGAWRRRGCVYLYVSDSRAFLLPDGQASVGPAELWEFITRHLPQDRTHG